MPARAGSGQERGHGRHPPDLVARHAPREPSSSSLQNGVGNVPVLRQDCPGGACWRKWWRSMCQSSEGDSPRHSGDIVIEQMRPKPACAVGAGADCARALTSAGVQWGSFVVNLNNASMRCRTCRCDQQLAQRAWPAVRRPDGRGLRAVRAEGIRPVSRRRCRRVDVAFCGLPDAIFAGCSPA